LWAVLTRPPDSVDARSSLIPLPQPYVRSRRPFPRDLLLGQLLHDAGVGAERAHRPRESTCSTLRTSDRDRRSHPNGNRSYYLTRSQPPYFAAMVGLYARATDTTHALAYLDALEKEYAFWMDGAENVQPGQSTGASADPEVVVLNAIGTTQTEPARIGSGPNVEHGTTVPVDLPGLHVFRSVHPEGVFFLERVEICEGMRRIGGAGYSPTIAAKYGGWLRVR